MDPMCIVEDTERTRFCPQTDRRTEGKGDNSIPPPPPFSTSLKRGGGIINGYQNSFSPVKEWSVDTKNWWLNMLSWVLLAESMPNGKI